MLNALILTSPEVTELAAILTRMSRFPGSGLGTASIETTSGGPYFL
jgi:hypothetical protein